MESLVNHSTEDKSLAWHNCCTFEHCSYTMAPTRRRALPKKKNNWQENLDSKFLKICCLI